MDALVEVAAAIAAIPTVLLEIAQLASQLARKTLNWRRAAVRF